MRSLVGILALAVSLLVVSGCAATMAPPAGAPELVPGRSHEVLMPGQYYFTFTLDAPARVVLESHTFPGDHHVNPDGQLLDREGQVVARDWHSGWRSNFRIEEDLPAGTWYLRVRDPFVCLDVIQCQERDHRYSVTLEIEEE